MALREAMTRYGKMIGAPSNISTVSVFRCIPYAKPPVGDRRWKEPEPLDIPDDPSAVEPRLCHSFAKMAMQMTMPLDMGPNKEGYTYPEPMDEDCLYLNVWTPAIKPDEKLPVMVWIHGGAYLGGHSYSSSINGEVFGKKGIILVSVAYRLTSFGFLAHPELSAESPHGVSGNYGTLDQIAALRWVYENIAAFGGDPCNITVFGQSAGSHSSQILASSPLSRDMVRRAILESGASMTACELLPMYPLADAEEFGVKIFEAAGISSLEEARALDARELLNRLVRAEFAMNNGNILDLHFAPNLDGYVLTERLGASISSGVADGIELMLGHTDEGGLDFPMPLEALPHWLAQFGEDAGELERLLDVKTQEELDAVNPAGFRGALVTASSALGESRAERGAKPSYYYYFKRPLPGDDQGAAHSAELFYVFDCLNNNWRPYVGRDYEIANAMNDYWANFAKTGDPNGEGLPSWEAFDPAAPARLRIEDDIAMEPLEHPAWQRFLIDKAKQA